MDDQRARRRRPGACACALTIGSLLNAACSTSATAPSSVATAVNLTGPYTLTLRMSARCADTSHAATFKATVNHEDSTVSLEVHVTLAGLQYAVTLHGSVDDHELRLRTADCGRFAREAFNSDLSPHETFSMCGSGVATMANPRHITGVFAGTLERYTFDETSRLMSSTACAAPDHTITLDAE
jgi:hypothetical protein